MASVTVHEAKTHLSKLLRRVAMGEEITILRGTTPVARLVPLEHPRRRQFGYDVGKVFIADDFDDPLPDDLLAEFYGE